MTPTTAPDMTADERDELFRAVDDMSDLELYCAYEEEARPEAKSLLLDEVNVRIAAARQPSAAETPGTIASACAFGWS